MIEPARDPRLAPEATPLLGRAAVQPLQRDIAGFRHVPCEQHNAHSSASKRPQDEKATQAQLAVQPVQVAPADGGEYVIALRVVQRSRVGIVGIEPRPRHLLEAVENLRQLRLAGGRGLPLRFVYYLKRNQLLTDLAKGDHAIERKDPGRGRVTLAGIYLILPDAKRDGKMETAWSARSFPLGRAAQPIQAVGLIPIDLFQKVNPYPAIERAHNDRRSGSNGEDFLPSIDWYHDVGDPLVQ